MEKLVPGTKEAHPMATLDATPKIAATTIFWDEPCGFLPQRTVGGGGRRHSCAAGKDGGRGPPLTSSGPAHRSSIRQCKHGTRPTPSAWGASQSKHLAHQHTQQAQWLPQAPSDQSWCKAPKWVHWSPLDNIACPKSNIANKQYMSHTIHAPNLIIKHQAGSMATWATWILNDACLPVSALSVSGKVEGWGHSVIPKQGTGHTGSASYFTRQQMGAPTPPSNLEC